MNAPVLTPLALQNADLLRAIRDERFTNVSELARHLGRDAENTRKTLKTLEKAGLLQLDGGSKYPVPVLVDLGHQALDALDRVEGSVAVPRTAQGPAELLHRQILPDPANPRKHFDPDALAELSASICQDELLENLVLRPIAGETTADGLPLYMLIAGERRWRAIGIGIENGGWPADKPIPSAVKDVDEQTARRLALVENLQRQDLDAMEEAHAIQELMNLSGDSAAKIGRDLGYTERWAQQRLSLLKLPTEMQGRVGKGLTVEKAREAVTLLPQLPPIKQEELKRGVISVEAAKAWLDEQPKPLSDAAKLAIMELWEKISADPYKGTHQKATKIVAEIERDDRGPNGTSFSFKVDDPKGAFAELRKRNLVDKPGRVFDEQVETGEVYATPGYNGEYYVKQVFPSATDAKFRKKNIPTLRVMVYGLQVDHAAEQSGGYATPWLNVPPFTPSPSVAAEIARNREAREERERKVREDREAYEVKRKKEERERQERFEASGAVEPELRQAAAVNGGAFSGLLTAKSAELGWTLPLYLAADGEIVDAAGQQFLEAVYHWQREARLPALRLLVAAVNVAAGLETPAARPVPMDPDAMPREEFVAAVVAGLIEESEQEGAPTPMSEEAAEEIAPRALEELLNENAWVYGEADAYDWDTNGAASLAGAIQRGEYGDAQIDLEDAIAEAESDD